MLTPQQCRRRRNLLKLSTAELSNKAQMSDFTVRRFEDGLIVRQQTVAMIAKALDRAEAAGPSANWIITPELSHAARELLGWNKDRLAANARLSVQTIIRFETRQSRVRGMTLRAMQAALEAAGVIFAPADGEGPRVRLRKSEP